MSGRVVVIGGGIVGTSVAWHLACDLGWGGCVTVLERDPTLAQASTGRSAAGIRQQFTTAVNIRLSRYGLDFLRRFRTEEGEAVRLVENGYLILAGDAAQAAALGRAHALQRAEGADVALLSPAELAARFPHLATGDLTLASLGLSGEGWFDPVLLTAAMRRAAIAAGAAWQAAESAGIERGADGAVCGVRLTEGGTVSADWVVLAAGVRAARLGATADVALPVEARKRTVFCIACAEPPAGRARLPLMVDPSGLWCRPEGAGFIAGRHPVPDPPAAPDDLEPRSHEFDSVIWPTLAGRGTCFEALRLTGLWAGHYAWNTHDQNAILGPAPGVPNLLLACGFSGHGVQQAPGVGRALAEWMVHGRYRTLDIAALHAERLTGAPEVEGAVY
ncbi:MAG: FAD-binding oxidoreductase [Pseudomonadota bacterium]